MRKCPTCGTTLRDGEILPVGHFPCPACRTQLQASDSYSTWIVGVNTLACLVISYALGFRNLHLVYAVLLAWWPLLYLFVNVGRYIVPPKVEIAAPAKSTSEIVRDAKRNISEIWRDEPLGLNLSDKKNDKKRS
jgi:hypothetical protein